MSTQVQDKAQEIKVAESNRVEKKQHDAKKQQSALIYAYTCFIESINASALQGNALLKQQQAGAKDASQLESMIEKFNQSLLAKTNAGENIYYTVRAVRTSYDNRVHIPSVTLVWSQGQGDQIKNKPYIDGNGSLIFTYTNNNAGHFTEDFKSHLGKVTIVTHKQVIPLAPQVIEQVDLKNESMSENRDYFRGQLTKVQQGNMLVGNNISALANAVSQETNEGMNCIHLMEKIGVQIAKSVSNQRQ